MKKYILMSFSLVFGLSAFAQSVTQQEMAMSLGNQVAFVVELEGANDNLAEDVWKEMLDDAGKVKRNKKAGEYYCEDCRISLVSSKPMQVTMKMEERKGVTMVSVFFDNGTAFVSSDTDASTADNIESFMNNYAIEVKKRVIQKELEEEEKSLKSFNKEYDKLLKQNEGFHDDIAKFKKKIVEAEENIEQNLKDQEQKQIEIKKQTSMVQDVTKRLNSVGYR